MNRLHKAILAATIISSSFVLFSCKDSVPSAAQHGKADITFKRSSSVSDNLQYVFETAPNGMNAIYAEKVFANDDSTAPAYIITASSSYDYPFEALAIYLVPEHKDKAGQTVEAVATIRVTEYRIDYDEAQEFNKETGKNELGYLAPKSFVYTLNSSNGFDSSCYSIPLSSDGHFKMNFSAGELNPVETEEKYAAEDERFSLISLDVVCPVMWRN